MVINTAISRRRPTIILPNTLFEFFSTPSRKEFLFKFYLKTRVSFSSSGTSFTTVIAMTSPLVASFGILIPRNTVLAMTFSLISSS